jgi:hypothetical protein
MQLELTDDEAKDLRDLLDGALGDMSSEIAATDNAEFRASLNERRNRLQQVRVRLDGSP